MAVGSRNEERCAICADSSGQRTSSADLPHAGIDVNIAE